jgi:hypothetical protein
LIEVEEGGSITSATDAYCSPSVTIIARPNPLVESATSEPNPIARASFSARMCFSAASAGQPSSLAAAPATLRHLTSQASVVSDPACGSSPALPSSTDRTSCMHRPCDHAENALQCVRCSCGVLPVASVCCEILETRLRTVRSAWLALTCIAASSAASHSRIASAERAIPRSASPYAPAWLCTMLSIISRANMLAATDRSPRCRRACVSIGAMHDNQSRECFGALTCWHADMAEISALRHNFERVADGCK